MQNPHTFPNKQNLDHIEILKNELIVNHIFVNGHMLAEQLTITGRSTPTPLSIIHAGMSSTSLYGVPIVTAVGHCRSKSCTRDTASAICRSSWGITTVDSCREDVCLTKSSCPMLVHVCTQKCTYTHTHTHTHTDTFVGASGAGLQ